MATLHKRNKHPMLILKGYRMFLMGYDDTGIAKSGVCATEIHKFKAFHEEMTAGKVFYRAAQAIGIEKYIAKKMLQMFTEWRTGEIITYGAKPSRETCPRIAAAYSLMLAGATDSEMKVRCTQLEIEKAKIFTMYINANMLPASISAETGILISTIKRMQKLYKDKCKLTECPIFHEQAVVIA